MSQLTESRPRPCPRLLGLCASSVPRFLPQALPQHTPKTIYKTLKPHDPKPKPFWPLPDASSAGKQA